MLVSSTEARDVALPRDAEGVGAWQISVCFFSHVSQPLLCVCVCVRERERERERVRERERENWGWISGQSSRALGYNNAID